MTKQEKIQAARDSLDADIESALNSFQSISAAAVSDADPPTVTVGDFAANAINFTFTGEPPYSLEYQDMNGDTAVMSWVPVSVNIGGYGDANIIISNPNALPAGIRWRATAGAGGDHISAFVTGEIPVASYSPPAPDQ